MTRLFIKLHACALFLFLAFSGTVLAADSCAEAEKNRLLTVDFYDRFFNKHDLSAADEYIGDVYIQHNPLFADGPKAFTDAFKEAFTKFPERQNKIIRSAAHGDIVFLHVHRTMKPGERGDAVVDIYRVQDGKLVEHWDIIQPVPETAKHGNGMF